jgi:ABC-type multidrug transport system fused ATPase/permease subunit
MAKTKKISRNDLMDYSLWETLKLAWSSYRKLLVYMRPYKLRFFWGVFFGVIAGLFNAVMILGFNIAFSIVLPGEDSIQPVKIPFLGEVDILAHIKAWFPQLDFNAGVPLAVVIGACALVPLLIFIRGMLTYFANYSMIWTGTRVLHDLRNDVFRSLLAQTIGYYSKAKVGQLVQTVFNQTRVAQQNLITLSQDLVQRPVAILSILGMLLYQNWVFTASSLIMFPLCIWPVMLVAKKVRQAGTKEEEEAGNLMVTMHESFTGIRVVKSHGREDYEFQRFNSANEKMNQMMMRWSKALEIIGPIVETVASVGIAIGLYYAWKIGMDAKDFMVIVMALTQIYPHAKALSRIQLLMQKTIVATSNIFGVMEEEPEVKDRPNAIELEGVQGALTFRKVTFNYHGEPDAVKRLEQRKKNRLAAEKALANGEKLTGDGEPAVVEAEVVAPEAAPMVEAEVVPETEVTAELVEGAEPVGPDDEEPTKKQKKDRKAAALKRVSLELQPGKFYALVGPSGAGKSTLFALILRFYDPTRGALLLDGVDIRKIKQSSLRSYIGVVSQETFLFHDSIENNIRYGRLDATKQEVIEAAKKAHAHDFIQSQEKGYDTMVGDTGSKLSGGQKQRISIARAILRNAPILLLDEATSALDTESEKIIQEAIHNLSEGKTVIAIAHRLSTILEADEIIVMNQGGVVDVGPHADLMQRCALYQRLYQLQFQSGDVDPEAAMEDVSFDEPFETAALDS